MPAYVVKASQRPVFASCANERLVHQFRGEVVPGLGNTDCVSYHLPCAREDPLSFKAEYFVVGIEASGKRPRTLNLALDVKKFGRDFHESYAMAPQHSTATRPGTGPDALPELELLKLWNDTNCQ